MPIGYIPLPMVGAIVPDGTGTGNNPPQPAREVSTAAQTTNTAKVSQVKWKFDAATDEHLFWVFQLPGNYASGGTLRGKCKAASATTGNMVWKASSVCPIEGVTDDDAAVFDAAVTATVAAPATQGHETSFTIALGMINAQANRKIIVMLGRDADNGADTMSGDAELTGLTFEYVTT